MAGNGLPMAMPTAIPPVRPVNFIAAFCFVRRLRHRSGDGSFD